MAMWNYKTDKTRKIRIKFVKCGGCGWKTFNILFIQAGRRMKEDIFLNTDTKKYVKYLCVERLFYHLRQNAISKIQNVILEDIKYTNEKNLDI